MRRKIKDKRKKEKGKRRIVVARITNPREHIARLKDRMTARPQD